MENFGIYMEIDTILKTWTELCGWKGFVSYDLGADISLPPCQIGGRLVYETAAHSISDPRAEISGTLVMVRYSSATSRGTTYWFQYFSFSCVPSISFVNAQVFRTRVLTIIKGKTYQREWRKQQRRSQGPRSLQHGGRMKAEWYPGHENWAKVNPGKILKKKQLSVVRALH